MDVFVSGLFFLFGYFAERDTKRVSYPFAIGVISLQAVSYMADFDFLWRVSQRAGSIAEEGLLLFGVHETEQQTGLAEVVFVLPVVPVVGCSPQAEWRLGEFRLLFPFTVTVGLVTRGAAVVAVHPHSAIAMVAMEGTARSVHRDQMVVHPETVALGIAVREQASLQHFVRRESDAWYHIRRVEGRLLDFGAVGFRVAVQFHDADFGQRIVLVEPHLGEVKWVVWAGGGILLRHYLNEELPPREIPPLNAFI